MQEIKAVTYFYDIGRDKFTGYSRSNSEYISNFIKFFSVIEIELLLITSANLKIEIEKAIEKKSHNFRTKLSYMILDYSVFDHPITEEEIQEIFGKSQMVFMSARSRVDVSRVNILKNGLVKTFSKMRSNTIFDLLPVNNSAAPEYSYSEYLRLVWLKPTIMKLAFESNFAKKTESVAFLDFGVGHGDSNFIKRLAQIKLSISDTRWDLQKLILTKRLPGNLTANPWDYAQLIDDAFIPTGFFISNYKSIYELEKWWNAKIIALSKEGIVVDDQTLMAIYSAERPDTVQFAETFLDKNLEGLEKWLPIAKFSQTEVFG